jgi:CHAD domain-containing protein
MSFEIKPDESVRKAIRRVVRKQLDKASGYLTKSKSDRDEAVHEARKAFKKVRALLRLVRPVIGDSAYRTQNACFRDTARPLRGVRDARSVLDALDQLTKHFKQNLAGLSFDDARKALQTNLRTVGKRILDEQDAFAVAAAAVREAEPRVKDWADVPNGWRSLGKGLEKVYRQAVQAFEDTQADPTAAKLHEWRKQTKYLRYQLQVLRPLWPERIDELAEEAGRLGQLLGDDHDLVILRQMLADSERFGRENNALLACIDRRRLELQEEAMPLGSRFFEEPPKQFVRLLKRYWKSWHRPVKSSQALERHLVQT